MKTKRSFPSMLFVTFAAFALCLTAYTGQAQAKKYLKLENKTQKKFKIKVHWRALGCAGISGGQPVVCKTRKIMLGAKSTQTTSYKYKWGTSVREVRVVCRKNNGNWHKLKVTTLVYKTLGSKSNPVKLTLTSSNTSKCKSY